MAADYETELSSLIDLLTEEVEEYDPPYPYILLYSTKIALHARRVKALRKTVTGQEYGVLLEMMIVLAVSIFLFCELRGRRRGAMEEIRGLME